MSAPLLGLPAEPRDSPHREVGRGGLLRSLSERELSSRPGSVLFLQRGCESSHCLLEARVAVTI